MESVVNKFPHDVILEILLKLSVKSLLRFRCICKAWCSLIKSHDFINMHYNRPTVETDHHVVIKRFQQDRVKNVLSVHSNTESLSNIFPHIQIPYMDHCQYVQVLGPANGVVCITDFATIILCNPATREFKLLPDRPFACPQDMEYLYCPIGFGFDANTNNYKVVRFVEISDEDDFTFNVIKAELYQHSTDSWKAIDYDPPNIMYEPCFETIFHEATHWYARREYDEKILSFNVSTEIFQEFDFPAECNGRRKPLTVLNEYLAMLYYICPRIRTYQQFIDIWIMKEYGISESWIKQLTVGPLSEIQHPITSWKNSSLLLEKTNGQLISCALDTQEVREFDVVAYPTTLRALIYKESLVSIK